MTDKSHRVPKGVIAIDGPAGAGKSTVAKIVAKEMGYLYVDTGAMYRAMTWKALKDGVNLHDPKALKALALNSEVRLVNRKRSNLTVVYLDGHDVTKKIRTEKVSRHTNAVAQVPAVRKILVARQRQMGMAGQAVLEGRDIGTAVFPDATSKFYLDASPSERAKRRYKELKARGKRVNLERIAHAIAQRDYRDKHRKHSPLTQARDAIVIDTTDLNSRQVAEKILEQARSQNGTH